jgi:hypothetical protein
MEANLKRKFDFLLCFHTDRAQRFCTIAQIRGLIIQILGKSLELTSLLMFASVVMPKSTTEDAAFGLVVKRSLPLHMIAQSQEAIPRRPTIFASGVPGHVEDSICSLLTVFWFSYSRIVERLMNPHSW